jgi:short-subunit dehydrogenase
MKPMAHDLTILSKEKWVLCGASRGLGAQFARLLVKQPRFPGEITLVTRKTGKFISEIESLNPKIKVQSLICDFSNRGAVGSFTEKLSDMKPSRLFYFAGGGPYGKFETKEWKDHLWSIDVSFSTPSFILYQSLRRIKTIQQMVFIGSTVAESDGDPNAASYAAAKHALKGLLSSVILEKPKCDIRLLSPWYMDTEMLPHQAPVRTMHKDKILNPETVALDLWQWIQSPTQNFHKEFRPLLV